MNRTHYFLMLLSSHFVNEVSRELLKMILFPNVALAMFKRYHTSDSEGLPRIRIAKQLYKAKQIGAIPIHFATKKRASITYNGYFSFTVSFYFLFQPISNQS
jgi:hypothetical protein